MRYVIFEVKTEDAGKMNKVTDDDLVSRQSILTRDARSLDVDKDVLYLKIEGSDEAVEKAKKLAEEQGFKKLDEKQAEDINQKIKEQEESAADGMGMIFD